MLKVIVTKIENVRKTQVVKYEVNVPKNVGDLDKYLKERLENGDLDLGKVISEETLEGETLEDDVSKIEVFYGNNMRVSKY